MRSCMTHDAAPVIKAALWDRYKSRYERERDALYLVLQTTRHASSMRRKPKSKMDQYEPSGILFGALSKSAIRLIYITIGYPDN